ncbi:MAG: DUF4147 domain-containing protein, partial [Bacteroidia bacterium]|nr:DUF4147 domain-containing protein [Bacteroidia bacterium]
TVTEAGHPVPDENSFRATEEILRIAEKAAEDDLVICLWSGGGSTLLADNPESSSPHEVMFFNEMLVRCGAEIREMNIIRKHLSKVKGGQLLKHIWPAASVSIFLSDVIGDPLDIIASGPTVPDNSTFAEALEILEKYHLKNDIPAGLLNYLEEGAESKRPETLKQNDDVFLKSATILAANNKTALQSAKAEAENLEFTTFIITNELAGNTEQACSYIIDSIFKYKNNSALKKPVCLLFGGEATVKVTGNGIGGRNQHLALTAALKIQNIPGITLLSAGTDGNDGNTEMAGAVADSETVHYALSMNVDPESYLKEFDSYHFFNSIDYGIFTGPTMTNVMDMVVVIIE